MMDERASLQGSPHAEAPWLVIPYGEGKQNHAFYSILEPAADDTTSEKFIPELSRKTFWQKPSHHGWLIVLCDVEDKEEENSKTTWKYGDCFLLNPLTLETIRLPSLLDWITYEEEYMLDCVLSSPPRTTTTSTKSNEVVDSNGGDPLVLVVYQQPWSDYGSYTFLFCHPGEKQWRTQLFSERIDGKNYELQYLHCFKGKLYALGINGDCLEIEKQHQVGVSGNNMSLSMKTFHVRDCNFPFLGSKDIHRGHTYFVEGHDDIFMIRVHFNSRGSETAVNFVCITRLDFIEMKWELVNNLGDDVLFVGRKNRLCCSAAKLGFTRGCLYYTLPFDEFCHTMGSRPISSKYLGLYKFEIESAGDYHILPCLSLPEPVFTPDWIMMPAGKQGKSGVTEDQEYILKAWENQLCITCDNDLENENASLYVKPEIEEKIPWDIVNEDMAVLISSYLHPLDYVYFRSVCKANRQIMPLRKSTFASTQTLETTYLSPWLLFCEDNSSCLYNLVNPMHDNENYLMNFSELLLGARVRFQKGGWLLMSREDKLFFYNPFTREIIILPDYPGCYNWADISFCSIPTSSDCIVFAIDGKVRNDDTELEIYCIKRGDKDWAVFDFDEETPYSPLRNTPIAYDGDFYSVGYDGALLKFNLEDDAYSIKVFKECHQKFKDSYPSFLAECGDDLLLVKLGCPEMPVRIFRLDFSKMEWVKVESLGKHMLFISDITCFSAVAPNSQMENNIYFPRLCLNGEGVLFYSLETGSYHSFGSQHSAKNFCGTKGWFRNCTWIEPNWSKSTSQELDWFKPLAGS